MRVCVSRLSLGPANLDRQVFLLSINVVEESERQGSGGSSANRNQCFDRRSVSAAQLP
jgi:hypothetical protein